MSINDTWIRRNSQWVSMTLNHGNRYGLFLSRGGKTRSGLVSSIQNPPLGRYGISRDTYTVFPAFAFRLFSIIEFWWPGLHSPTSICHLPCPIYDFFPPFRTIARYIEKLNIHWFNWITISLYGHILNNLGRNRNLGIYIYKVITSLLAHGFS